MRITSGTLKGRQLISPKKTNFRPTSTRLREVIFNLLINAQKSEFDISSCNFLDICSGTGAMGIEAISRGFPWVTFVDKNIKTTRLNIEKLHLSNKCKLIQADILKLYQSQRQHHICYIDPPYEMTQFKTILQKLSEKEWLHNHALCIFEHSQKVILPEIPEFLLIEKRDYGSSTITILKYKASHL